MVIRWNLFMRLRIDRSWSFIGLLIVSLRLSVGLRLIIGWRLIIRLRLSICLRLSISLRLFIGLGLHVRLRLSIALRITTISSMGIAVRRIIATITISKIVAK